jgi:hypothetical protein
VVIPAEVGKELACLAILGIRADGGLLRRSNLARIIEELEAKYPQPRGVITDEELEKESAFAEVYAAAIRRGKVGRPAWPPGMAEYIGQTTKSAQYFRIIRKAKRLAGRGFSTANELEGPLPPSGGPTYTDGLPYCPHCGMFVQPFNRAYDASRNAANTPAPQEENPNGA